MCCTHIIKHLNVLHTHCQTFKCAACFLLLFLFCFLITPLSSISYSDYFGFVHFEDFENIAIWSSFLVNLVDWDLRVGVNSIVCGECNRLVCEFYLRCGTFALVHSASLFACSPCFSSWYKRNKETSSR